MGNGLFYSLSEWDIFILLIPYFTDRRMGTALTCLSNLKQRTTAFLMPNSPLESRKAFLVC